MPDKKDVAEHLDKNVSSDEKILGAIAYIFLLCLVPLLGKRSSEFAQFHAKQGLALVVGWFAVMLLGMIPVLGWLIVLPVGTLLLIIFSVMGIINALQGVMRPIPLLGQFAQRIHLD